MMKNYFIFYSFLFSVYLGSAQEIINLSNYNGSAINVTATSTVNDNITIVFEDADIVNNFYTDLQSEIYLFGGLDTSSGGFQGSPDFNDLNAQPILNLVPGDTNNNAAPNTYSLTINLSQHYSGVPDGTMVFGFNLLFQNQFGGGGNNQTVDLYIDLTDALKNSVLGIDDNNSINDLKVNVTKKRLSFSGYYGTLNLSIYNIMGQKVLNKKNVLLSNNSTLDLIGLNNGMYILKIFNQDISKTLKILLQ